MIPFRQFTGIELPPDFSREIDRVSVADNDRTADKAIAKGFRFPKETSEKYFDTEKASPELMALGASLAESNPLKAKAFREEDLRWAKMSHLTRSVSRLLVYSVALVRAEELGIIPEDRALFSLLCFRFQNFLVSQASRATAAVFVSV